jgi:hypothetical protein
MAVLTGTIAALAATCSVTRAAQANVPRCALDGFTKSPNEHIIVEREKPFLFKATVDGWQSVVGVIVVTKAADPGARVRLDMNLGR